jgi:hypothetical protein
MTTNPPESSTRVRGPLGASPRPGRHLPAGGSAAADAYRPARSPVVRCHIRRVHDGPQSAALRSGNYMTEGRNRKTCFVAICRLTVASTPQLLVTGSHGCAPSTGPSHCWAPSTSVKNGSLRPWSTAARSAGRPMVGVVQALAAEGKRCPTALSRGVRQPTCSAQGFLAGVAMLAGLRQLPWHYAKRLWPPDAGCGRGPDR